MPGLAEEFLFNLSVQAKRTKDLAKSDRSGVAQTQQAH